MVAAISSLKRYLSRSESKTEIELPGRCEETNDLKFAERKMRLGLGKTVKRGSLQKAGQESRRK